jgi:hypothetical protein
MPRTSLGHVPSPAPWWNVIWRLDELRVRFWSALGHSVAVRRSEKAPRTKRGGSDPDPVTPLWRGVCQKSPRTALRAQIWLVRFLN